MKTKPNIQKPETSDQHPVSPYKGLETYSADDRDLFFGCDDDRQIVVAKVFSARVTLFFGVTGAGKSSLLQAGVIPELRDPAGYNLDVISHFKWNPHEDPRISLKNSLKEEFLRSGILSSKNPPGWDKATLRDCVERYEVFASDPFVIVIDQFEEFFLYHAYTPRFDKFIQELADLMNDRSISVAFILAMREDFLAELDVFLDRVPSISDNRYRLEKLTTERAREAIVKPIEQEQIGFTYEPELVEHLLQDLAGEEQKRRVMGEHGLEQKRSKGFVEAAYLQIVCQKLWQQEQHNPQKRLRLTTYQDDLGGTQQIVREYVESVMEELTLREQSLAFEMFQYLVTSRGTKMAYRDADLADTLGVPPEQVRPVLEHLEQARILRRDNRPDGLWYELYHDVFAEIIRGWTEQFQGEQDRYIYSQITTAVREWKQQGEDENALLKGGLLSQAEEWGQEEQHEQALSSEEQTFLKLGLKKYYRGVWLRRDYGSDRSVSNGRCLFWNFRRTRAKKD